MFTPSRRHWKVSGPVPLTPTANDADCPAFTASETGCATIVGATTAGVLAVTVSVAAALTDIAGIVGHADGVGAGVRIAHSR